MTNEVSVSPNRRLSTSEMAMLMEPQDVHILVVDDDYTTRAIVTNLLSQNLYQVTAVASGPEALELLKSTKIDLMLVDVFMPEMDGYALLNIYRQASSRDIPTIMMSACNDSETISKSFQSGANDFLQKPIRQEMLLKRIESCLEERRRLVQEKLFRKMLEKEREKGQQLQAEVQQKQSELELIRSQITSQIETPVQVVMDTMRDLMSGEHTPEQYRRAMMAVLRSLGSSDLYRPAFSKAFSKISNLLNKKQIQQKEQQQTTTESKSGTGTGTEAEAEARSVTGSGSDMDEATLLWLITEYTPQHEKPVEANMRGASQLKILPSPESDSSLEPFEIITPPPEILEQLRSFAFDSFAFSPQELMSFVMFIFSDLGLVEKFNLSVTKLWAFLKEVSNQYIDNPYHNFRHAMDVTQFIYACLCDKRVNSMLRDLDKLALVTASICHDVGHPGLNNNFHMNDSTDLALTYNDLSILENYHCTTAFNILRDQNSSIIEALNNQEYKDFRSTVIGIVLSTDMAKHFEILSKFQTRLLTSPLSKDSRDDRQAILNYLMKCGDISNATRPFPICKNWSQCLIQEFLCQGDKEREKGLPISPYMDRNALNFAKMQVDFIDFVAAPLYKNLVTSFPNFQVLCDTLQENRSKWEKIYQEAHKQPPAATIPEVRHHAPAPSNPPMEVQETAASPATENPEITVIPAPVSNGVALSRGNFHPKTATNDTDRQSGGSTEVQNNTNSSTTKPEESSTSQRNQQSGKRDEDDEFPDRTPVDNQQPIFGEFDSSDQPGKGISILVVEDDETCRKLCSRILTGAGYIVDNATNGQEAVDMAKSKNYDLILMDCGLPVMDGYTATRLIRKHEETSGRHVPIIAITAFSLEVAKDKCLRSGMDLCLVKPIHKRQLLTTIGQWTPKKPIDIDTALEQSGGDVDFLTSLLQEFMEETRRHIQVFDQELKSQNWETLRLEAHSLKGAAATLAAAPLSEAAFVLEQEAKTGHFTQKMAPAISEISAQFEALHEHLLAQGYVS